jgi:hypothetical protein
MAEASPLAAAWATAVEVALPWAAGGALGCSSRGEDGSSRCQWQQVAAGGSRQPGSSRGRWQRTSLLHRRRQMPASQWLAADRAAGLSICMYKAHQAGSSGPSGQTARCVVRGRKGQALPEWATHRGDGIGGGVGHSLGVGSVLADCLSQGLGSGLWWGRGRGPRVSMSQLGRKKCRSVRGLFFKNHSVQSDSSTCRYCSSSMP